MLRFLFQRSLQGILILWGIVTLLFGVFYVLDSPINYMVGEKASKEVKQAIAERYGLNESIPIQYLHYLHKISPLGVEKGNFGFKKTDFGRSYQGNFVVSDLIANHLTGTAILASTSLFFAAIVGIFLGVIAALNKDKSWDKFILSLSVLGISAPSFFVGVILMWIFAVTLRNFTHLEVIGYMFVPDLQTGEEYIVWKHLFLPTLALAIRPLAVFVQLTRSSLLEVLKSDYIRTARAKGLSETVTLFRHALRNALNPVATSVTGWLASLLAGAFFIEYMFNWKGIGKLTIDSLSNRDFPIILGCTLTVGLIFVVINLLTDLLYAWLDPRVKIS